MALVVRSVHVGSMAPVMLCCKQAKRVEDVSLQETEGSRPMENGRYNVMQLEGKPLYNESGEYVGAPRPSDEKERNQVIERSELTSPSSEEEIDRITRLLKAKMNVDAAAVTEIYEDQHLFKSTAGSIVEVCGPLPRSHSLCAWTLLTNRENDVLVVPDLKADEKFKENPSTKLIGAYIACPIEVNGKKVGTLCAFNRQPRGWSQEDVELVGTLSELVTLTMNLRAHSTAPRHTQAEDLRGEHG